MSRWSDEFQQHKFRDEWKKILEEAKTLKSDDITITTNIQEISRIKKVVSYLDQILQSIDPELTPQSIWDSYHSQCVPCLQNLQAYQTNRNPDHLRAANQHLDNLLTYVRPYMVQPQSALKGIRAATKAYQQEVESHLTRLNTQANEYRTSTHEQLEHIKGVREQIEEFQSQIADLYLSVYSPHSPSEGIAAKIRGALESSGQQSAEIFQLHEALLVDRPDAPSTKTVIDTLKTEVGNAAGATQTILDKTQEEVRQLSEFHEKIFGVKSDAGKFEGGLKEELTTRINALDQHERDQKRRLEALHKKVEELLPGATSAGLARAYQELRRSYSPAIKSNTKLFYIAIFSIPTIALVSSIESISFSPLSISLTPLNNFDAILKSIITKTPFIAPLIWLGVFASTRRSQYERLQQEYAHKEALAKSYESYKRQLEALMTTESEPLQKELIARAIDAIAFNASITLDGKHRDKMPIESVLEALNDDKHLGLLERLKKLISS